MSPDNKKDNDIPKMHLLWFSTIRGISEMKSNSERVYYGKVFRIQRDGLSDSEYQKIEGENLDWIEQNVIYGQATEGGVPVECECFERYDTFDAETGDLLVLYRVPHKSTSEPATSVLPPLSRKVRYAKDFPAGNWASALPVPPNAGHSARVLIGRLLRLLQKHAPDKSFKLPAEIAAEQRALALLTVAAHELAVMDNTPHRQAIISQMGDFLEWLVKQADTPPETPPFTIDDMKEAVSSGAGFVIENDDEDTPAN